jgi:hypothetical protein
VDATEPSVAVAATPESTAIQVVLPDRSAPMRYTYEIGHAVPRLEPDGAVSLTNAVGEVVGFAEAPWAVDAAGEVVPTRYEVTDGALIQVIEPTDSTQFPVVADPDFIFFAKCSAGIAIFAAENAAWMGQFWKVFKSAKKLAELFKDIRKMSKGGKISYLKSKLGSVASDMTGFGDLVSRCTP